MQTTVNGWTYTLKCGEIDNGILLKAACSRVLPAVNLPTGAQGGVQAHAKKLDGIFAKGTYWWKVAFGSTTAWVDERSLFLRSTGP